ncbi:hypothetical protein HYPSUDRAFT_537907 [Hypholoma sublateritium FD-334 SS-4]|uniref:Uncharacterized protein n=1 Tax=Hypholoma sublateritium (strain FD-334 SS-4) TaxID=945553 RepID=A0A0D2PXV8_HYPSF|nr:hypothetical protein HYPSUDRAFT_537907 [Hypholoma sublateritium FD-334 SS-4]
MHRLRCGVVMRVDMHGSRAARCRREPASCGCTGGAAACREAVCVCGGPWCVGVGIWEGERGVTHAAWGSRRATLDGLRDSGGESGRVGVDEEERPRGRETDASRACARWLSRQARRTLTRARVVSCLYVASYGWPLAPRRRCPETG